MDGLFQKRQREPGSHGWRFVGAGQQLASLQQLKPGFAIETPVRLVRPEDVGDRAAVAAELPTYASVLPLLEINGLRVAGFGMGPDGGDLREIERVLENESPAFVYLGTFSKVLFPGFRIGWITADRELIRRLAAVKRFTDHDSETGPVGSTEASGA